MVRALLAGTKTQTRRVVKPQPDVALPGPIPGAGVCGRYTPDDERLGRIAQTIPCPYGAPSDRLWVRETFYAWGRWETRFSAKKGRDEWHFVDMTLECGKAYEYPASGGQPQPMGGRRSGGVTPKWWKRPAIHMPRAASRITLEITGVRVERLNAISDADAEAEGLCKFPHKLGFAYAWRDDDQHGHGSATGAFRDLWKSINGAESWDANPWVWVVEFKRIGA